MPKQTYRYCDGIHRRDFLRIGAASALGLNLTLPSLFASPAAPAAAPAPKKNDVSVIMVFLMGGPSQLETFDPKPDAPVDVRGEFGTIPTKTDGLLCCDLLPRVARQSDKFSVLRAFTHRNASHGDADHYMLTGYHPAAGFQPTVKPNNQFPAHGSVVAKHLGPRGGSVPPYVCLPSMNPSGGSAFLGADAVPFTIDADPNSPSFAVPDMAPPLTVDAARLDARHELLARVDRYRHTAELAANAKARGVGTFGERAVELMTSPAARRAFDIAAEPAALRDEYGRHTLGQSCLMARRLVEAGVRYVTINHANWDTHYGNFTVLKNQLLPQLDAAMSTLFRDLADRGLLDRTMVVFTGEFGRTPRINKDAGRDHWSKCFSVAVGGGGIQGNRVIGQSDKWAQEPATHPFGPEDLAATIFDRVGIDPAAELMTPEGRPIGATNNGRVIRELL